MAAITTLAAAGPSVQARSAPPTRCPLVPGPTGKLIIWAANTKAPITPSSGALDSSNPRCARRVIATTAGSAAASSAPHTGVERNPSGICTFALQSSTILTFVPRAEGRGGGAGLGTSGCRALEALRLGPVEQSALDRRGNRDDGLRSQLPAPTPNPQPVKMLY